MNIHLFRPLVLVLFVQLFISCRDSSKSKDTSVHEQDSVAIKADKKTSVQRIDTMKYVMLIEKYQDSIDRKLKSLKKIRKDVFGASTEGGEISLYVNKNDTLKIRAIYYGEMGKNEYSFYLRDKKLVLFREEMTYYKSPIGKTPTIVDSIAKSTFILKNESLLKRIQKEIITGGENFEQKRTEIIDLFKEIILQAKE